MGLCHGYFRSVLGSVFQCRWHARVGACLDLLLMKNVELFGGAIADGSLGCSDSGGQSIKVPMEVRKVGSWINTLGFRRVVLGLLRELSAGTCQRLAGRA